MKTVDKKDIDYLASKKEIYTFEDLQILAAVLRSPDGCPWDREQTHASVRKDIIEETYEVIEAIDNSDPVLMREELGDLLWQIIFHARLEEEAGNCDMDDIVHDICYKLVSRHPHVFGEVVADTSAAVLTNWEKNKTEEKHRDTVTSRLRAVPPALPALMRAQKVGKVTSFFDFRDANEVFCKLNEETDELKEAVDAEDRRAIEEEYGDLLFAAVSLARKLGVNAEEALTKATNKYINRFEILEEAVTESGRKVTELSQEELDEVWDRIKHNVQY